MVADSQYIKNLTLDKLFYFRCIIFIEFYGLIQREYKDIDMYAQVLGYMTLGNEVYVVYNAYI